MPKHRFLSDRLLYVATWPARVIQARRDFASLAALGERELRDIGLSLQDLRDATALPLSENATHVLARRAEERAAFVLATRGQMICPTPAAKREAPPAMAGDWRGGIAARADAKGAARP